MNLSNPIAVKPVLVMQNTIFKVLLQYAYVDNIKYQFLKEKIMGYILNLSLPKNGSTFLNSSKNAKETNIKCGR